MPFDLPNSFYVRIGHAIIAFRAANSAKRPKPSSPLHAILILRAVLAAGTAPDQVLADCIDDAIELADRLARVFTAFVTYGAKAVAHDTSWQCLADDVALPLLRSWADAMTSGVASSGSDPAEVAKLIRALTRSDLATELMKQPRSPWYYAYADDINTTQFRAAILASAVDATNPSGLTHGQASQLKVLIGHDGSKGWFPMLDLTFPPISSPEGFWPGRDTIPVFLAAGWLELDSPSAVRDASAIARQPSKRPIPPIHSHTHLCFRSSGPVRLISPCATMCSLTSTHSNILLRALRPIFRCSAALRFDPESLAKPATTPLCAPTSLSVPRHSPSIGPENP